MNMQVKLLRVLQEKVVLPVGSNQPQSVDIRVVAATHRVLEDEIKAGRFRADLYYRLNVVPLQVQPLRSRCDELPALIRHFAKLFAGHDTPAIAFTDDFMEVMQRYDWPGNVRELSNMIHRLSVLYPGQTLHMNHVAPSMLPLGMAELVTERTDSDQGSLFDLMMQDDTPATAAQGAESTEGENDVESIVMHAQGFEDFRQRGQSLKGMLSDIEQGLIERALRESDGNVSRCAKLLRMQRTTLIERIKKYKLNMHAA
jgi:sigma-54 specific flagellar transcriptional regulator A